MLATLRIEIAPADLDPQAGGGGLVTADLDRGVLTIDPGARLV